MSLFGIGFIVGAVATITAVLILNWILPDYEEFREDRD